MPEITKKEMKTLLKAQQGELDAVVMYRMLSGTVKDQDDAETFKRLAAEEGHHASVFRKMTGMRLKPRKIKGVLLSSAYRILGRKKLYPLIAKGEYSAEKTYEPVVKRFPNVESVQADEKQHGDTIMSLLDHA